MTATAITGVRTGDRTVVWEQDDMWRYRFAPEPAPAPTVRSRPPTMADIYGVDIMYVCEQGWNHTSMRCPHAVGRPRPVREPAGLGRGACFTCVDDAAPVWLETEDAVNGKGRRLYQPSTVTGARSAVDARRHEADMRARWRDQHRRYRQDLAMLPPTVRDELAGAGLGISEPAQPATHARTRPPATRTGGGRPNRRAPLGKARARVLRWVLMVLALTVTAAAATGSGPVMAVAAPGLLFASWVYARHLSRRVRAWWRALWDN